MAASRSWKRDVERRAPFRLRVPAGGKVHLKGQHVLGAQAKIHGREPLEAAQQQSGAGQEHEGERDLGDHEHLPEAGLPAAAARAAARLAQHAFEIRARVLQRRRQTERESGHERDDETESEDGSASARAGGDAGDRFGRGGEQQARDGLRAGEADDAAGERQQQAFDDELPRQPPPRAAERGTNGELLLARRAARQDEPGDVHAGNRQQQRDRAEEYPQQASGRPDGVDLQRRDARPPTSLALAVVGLDLERDCFQLRLRLLERGPRPQTADDAQVVVVPLRPVRTLEVERRPDLDAGHERVLEGIGHHRDDLLTDAVDRQRLSDRVGTRAEILAPDPLADDDDAGIGALGVSVERLPGQHPHADHAEVVGSDRQDADALGLGAIGEVRALAVVGVDRRQIERRAVVPERAERRLGHVVVGLARDVIHADEPVRIVIRQRPEHDGVQHAEDRRVRPQSQGESEDDDRGELLRGGEGPHRINDVSFPAFHRFLLSGVRRSA